MSNPISGTTIITNAGLQAIQNAITNNTQLNFATFQVTSYPLTPNMNMTTIPNYWYSNNINSIIPIDPITIQIIIDVPLTESTSYFSTAGIFLEDGTLFAIIQPSNPIPPKTRQVANIQLQFTNAQSICNFNYLPWSQQEQYLSITNTVTELGANINNNSQMISLLQTYCFVSSKALIFTAIQPSLIMQQNTSSITFSNLNIEPNSEILLTLQTINVNDTNINLQLFINEFNAQSDYQTSIIEYGYGNSAVNNSLVQNSSIVTIPIESTCYTKIEAPVFSMQQNPFISKNIFNQNGSVYPFTEHIIQLLSILSEPITNITINCYDINGNLVSGIGSGSVASLLVKNFN